MAKHAIPYVEKVGEVWTYRRDVPADVRALIKKRRWSESLRTRDLWEAAEPARRLRERHNAEIKAAREILNLSPEERARIDDAGGVEGYLRFLDGRSQEVAKLVEAAQDMREWAASDGPDDEIPDPDWARTEVETFEAKAESIRRHLAREAPLIQKARHLKPIEEGSALAAALGSLPPVEETATIMTVAAKKAKGLANASQIIEPAKIFVELHGDVVMKQITEGMIRKFRDHMTDGIKDGRGAGRWAASTAKKHFSVVKTLCKFAKSEGYLGRSPNPAIEIEWRAERGSFREAKRKKRLTFSVEQVRQILGELDKLDLEKPKNLDVYWFMRVLLWSGARPEELAQLVPENITKILGVPCIRINDALPFQKIKTPNAERDVPIHQALIGGGFMEFVESRKGQRMLFATLKQDKRGRWYSNMRKRLLHLIRNKMGIKDPRIVPYSARHTFIDCLRTVGTPPDIEDRLVGHSTKGRRVHDGYGTPQTMRMNEWLQKADPLKEGRRVREFDDDGDEGDS